MKEVELTHENTLEGVAVLRKLGAVLLKMEGACRQEADDVVQKNNSGGNDLP